MVVPHERQTEITISVKGTKFSKPLHMYRKQLVERDKVHP
jgi:hypothetical protein